MCCMFAIINMLQVQLQACIVLLCSWLDNFKDKQYGSSKPSKIKGDKSKNCPSD